MNDMVTISRAEHQRLLAIEEDFADLRAYDHVKAILEAGEDELVPAALVDRLLAGESALRVWREYRGMTQAQLAVASSVNRVQIADIESGKSVGSVATVKKLAEALSLSIHDLVW